MRQRNSNNHPGVREPSLVDMTLPPLVPRSRRDSSPQPRVSTPYALTCWISFAQMLAWAIKAEIEDEFEDDYDEGLKHDCQQPNSPSESVIASPAGHLRRT
jgi:hypothetical protein